MSEQDIEADRQAALDALEKAAFEVNWYERYFFQEIRDVERIAREAKAAMLGHFDLAAAALKAMEDGDAG